MHGFDSLPTVIFLLVVMVTASPVQGRNLIHVDDNYALRMLKVHAQGNLTLQSWNFANDPCGHEQCQLWEHTTAAAAPRPDNDQNAPPLCNFGGVACEGWRVSGLSLSGNDLASLPLELGRLASLRSLDLSRAGISGRLSPQLLEGLSNLEALSLASNNLTGTIPPELSALSSLRTLDLSNNTLQGTIPSSLGIPGLANLEFLDLSDNSLTGRLPGGFADMRALRSLDVSGNCGICGGPPAPAPGMTLEATLEVFNYTGTHLWMPCEVLSEMRRCPDGVANFEALHTSILTTILQVVIGTTFLLLGSILTTLVTSYLRTSGSGVRCLCCWQPPREPTAAARDEAELTAAALEAAERESQAGLSSSGPPSLQPPPSLKPSRSIGAVIINPGSTIQQPNICVAIMELDERQEALQRSASVPEPPRLPRPQQPPHQDPGSSAISRGLGSEQHLPERGARSDAALPAMQRAASVPVPQLGSAATAASHPDRQPSRTAASEQVPQESLRQSMWRRISMRWQEHLRGDAAEGPGTQEQQGRGNGGVHQQVMMFI